MLWAAAAAAVLSCGVQPAMGNNDGTPSSSHAVKPVNIWAKNMRIGAIPTSNTATTEPTKDDENYTCEEDGENSTCADASVASGTVIESQDSFDEDEESSASSDCQIPPAAAQSCQEKCAYRSLRIGLGFLVAMYVVIVFLMIGSFVETGIAARAPDTSSNFITDQVCAFHRLDTSQPFETFDTKELAIAAGCEVAHCGACGHCSNPVDIRSYVNTRETVAVSAKKCSAKVVLGSHEDLMDCLQDHIGFSRDCTECWADNMINTAKRCLSTCVANRLNGLATRNTVIGAGEDEVWLNECIFCDEKRSGTEFVTCSGVARRRLGIQSEIERNPAEQCKKVEIDWVLANFTDIFPGVSFPDV